MKKYRVVLLPDANRDFDKYIDYIVYNCHSPRTALKHRNDLVKELKSLEVSAESYPIKPSSRSLFKYGEFVRTVNFKKMTIVYTVHGDVVCVHRIIASSLLTDL